MPTAFADIEDELIYLCRFMGSFLYTRVFLYAYIGQLGMPR
jgi:hypothetical protein